MDKKDTKEIGLRIRDFRKSLKLSQEEFADSLGVSGRLVSAYELGTEPIPTARLYQISSVFGVSREWLETGEGEPLDEPIAEPIEEAARRVAIFYAYQLLEKLPKDLQDHVVAVLKGIVEAKRRDEKKEL